MKKEKDLSRFIEAQNGKYAGYAAALAEFKEDGYKSGHWIWYVFPQLAHEFPGQSETNIFYSLQGVGEARAYMADATLGPRLVEISTALLGLENNDPEDVMNSWVDAKKLCSCMTLFSAVAPEQPVFNAVLEKFFGGKKCEWTQAALSEVK